jgi:hypothetical protein
MIQGERAAGATPKCATAALHVYSRRSKENTKLGAEAHFQHTHTQLLWKLDASLRKLVVNFFTSGKRLSSPSFFLVIAPNAMPALCTEAKAHMHTREII